MGQQAFYVKTKILEPTILNSKRIKIRVQDGCVISGGLFQANYL